MSSTDSVTNTFKNIAADIRVPSLEKNDLETKLRAFLKSNAQTMLMPTALDLIHTDSNIREISENPEEFQALISSIRAAGVIQPPVLAVQENATTQSLDFVCVAGHRRLAAAKEAGLEKVTCIIRKFAETHLQMISTIIENTHRKNLHPFELATGIRNLVQCGYLFTELENLFDRNQWNLRRYNKMNDWTPITRKLVLEHPDKFTPSFLLHLAARAMEPAEVEIEIKKKLGLIEGTSKTAKANLTDKISDFCIKRNLSLEQKKLIEEALVALGFVKAPKNASRARTSTQSSMHFVE